MFTKWLADHIKLSMLEMGMEDNRRSFKLTEHDEGVRMTLRVDDVPYSAIVMRFDKGERRQLFEVERGYDFLMRCDFMILDETEAEYRAIFVELKRSFGDRGSESWLKQKGEKQLRWSLPSLKYLLSVFEIDSCNTDQSKKVVAKFFCVAKCPNQWYRKRKPNEVFKFRYHEGIPIYYSTSERLNFKVLDSGDLYSILS